MIDKYFKPLLLALLAALVFVIYIHSQSQRYKIQGNPGNLYMMDTQTGTLYENNGIEWEKEIIKK